MIFFSIENVEIIFQILLEYVTNYQCVLLIKFSLSFCCVSDKKSLTVKFLPPPFLRRITFMKEKYLSVLGSVGFHMSPEPCVFVSTESRCNKRSRSKTPKSGKRPSDNLLSCLAECIETLLCHFSADDSKLYRIHPPSFVNK